jgi:hypothetical protein
MPGKKHKANKQVTQISKGILDLLHQTFPEEVVEMTVTAEESYLADVYPKLTAKLWKIRGAVLLYERQPNPEPEWADGDDPFEDPPLDTELSASYHLFFLALADKRFTYESEDEAEDEHGELQKLTGQGRLGCAMAVSVLAPVAVVRFDTMEQYDDGSSTLPDIWDNIFALDGQPIPPEVHIQERFGSQAVRALTSLRNRLTKVLEALGIALLPAAEACKPVAWLKAGEDAFVGEAAVGKPITVQDAFFFRGP